MFNRSWASSSASKGGKGTAEFQSKILDLLLELGKMNGSAWMPSFMSWAEHKHDGNQFVAPWEHLQAEHVQ